MTRLRAIVRGKVQGVGFRAWTDRTANQLGVAGGLVRNLRNGDVEVIAESPDRLTLEWLLQGLHHGPHYARVDGVEAVWEEDVEPRFLSFRVAEA